MGFFDDYARLAQAKVTTTPHQQGGGTMTTANWWETPGLTPDQYGASSPRVDLMGPTRFQTPGLWYDFYQGLDDAAREELTFLDSPIDDQPFSTEEAPGGMEFPDLEPKPIPEWVEGATNQLLDFFDTRMSDDFTLFTPAMRGQLSAQIGRQIALANRGAVEQAALAGAGASGIESQLRSEAALGGAGALGMARAQMEGMDEQSRQWAANQLRGFTSPVQQAHYGYLSNLGNLGPQFAALASEGMWRGPDVTYDDPASWSFTSENITRFEEELERLEAQGQVNPEELAALFLEAFSTGMIGR